MERLVSLGYNRDALIPQDNGMPIYDPELDAFLRTNPDPETRAQAIEEAWR
ncbi:MAG TPA: hypothetical protein VNK67_02880 [Burkholderiales bacterium]|nr:hypothetical protein [Burkholderiales bacterium]